MTSRDLKNFFGFGAPTETSFNDDDARFKSDAEDAGRTEEKLPHLPTMPPDDFDATAEKTTIVNIFYV